MYFLLHISFLCCLLGLAVAQTTYKTKSLCSTIYATSSVVPQSIGYILTVPITLRARTTVTPTSTVTLPLITTTSTDTSTVSYPGRHGSEEIPLNLPLFSSPTRIQLHPPRQSPRQTRKRTRSQALPHPPLRPLPQQRRPAPLQQSQLLLPLVSHPSPAHQAMLPGEASLSALPPSEVAPRGRLCYVPRLVIRECSILLFIRPKRYAERSWKPSQPVPRRSRHPLQSPQPHQRESLLCL